VRDRALAALLLILPLALFGEVLVRRTHHRPLGAATYASVTVLAFLLCWMLVARLPGASSPAAIGRRLTWALGGVGFLIAMSRLIG
jgi:hypothetical protein